MLDQFEKDAFAKGVEGEGDAEGLYLLAVAYLFGSAIVEKDVNHGKELLRQSAHRKYAKAQTLLGISLREGINGCKVNTPLGTSYLAVAAEQQINPDPVALAHFGWCCVTGDGHEQDIKKGLGYLERAASRGDVMAQKISELVEAKLVSDPNAKEYYKKLGEHR